MTITRNFKLCLNAGTQNAPYINVNQYDEGEEWVFDLYTEGGQKFTPSTGAIIGIKSDGNAILNSGTVNSDGQVVITETQQMTAASGLAVFELLIEGETHGTANFIVNVERRPSDDAEFSDSDLSMLQEAIDAAEVINEILDEGGDPSEIIAENVNNWLDNHPEATTTVQDGAITAPKINNSLWDKILVNEEASGNPASFEDGADDVPVSSLKVNLEPIQTGSGDPSPTNIRPIYPANGKNQYPIAIDADTWIDNSSATHSNNDGELIIICTSSNASGVFGNGTQRNLVNNQNVAKTISFDIKATTVATIKVQSIDVAVTTSYTRQSITIPANKPASLSIYGNGTANTIYVKNLMISEISETAYQPYQGIMVERTGENVSPVSYPISLGREVYGGTVDLATGVLTVTDGYIASYNGETLPSTWISDRDVYASGTTPTTGAQVVYKLATPQTYQLTPQEVKTLLGYNNISSTGTVDVIYHADTKLYIDKRIAELG